MKKDNIHPVVTFPLLEIKRRAARAQTPAQIARQMTSAAISRKIIARQPCCICGAPKADAHHEDYKRPNEIVFLCRPHHGQRHRELGWGMGRTPSRRALGKSRATRLSGDLRDRLDNAVRLTGIRAADLIRHGVRKVVTQIEKDGGLIVRAAPPQKKRPARKSR